MANPISLTVRLQSALNQSSLSLRCQEVSQILHEVSSKDANFILRVVIESIFGVTSDVTSSTFHNSNPQLGGGWGLKVITLGEHRIEFETMRSFLAPNGPLLSLVYKLAHDPFQLLPFPISCLPARIKSEIEDGTAGLFYSSKVQTLGPGKSPANIMLNAFEFYIFHFAYFLVNLSNSHHWNLVWMSANESLYPTLLEDYLGAYLPCDASMPPGPPTTPVSPRGVLSTMSQRTYGVSPYQSNPQLHLSSIVSPIPSARSPDGHNYHYSDIGSGMQTSSPVNSSHMYGSHQSQTDLNIWTTQVVSQVLLEMWIISYVPSPSKSSSNSVPQQSNTNSMHPTLYNGSNTENTGYYPDLNLNFFTDFTPIEYRPYWQQHLIHNVFLPSSDHVRVVRILIKHFHYFSNSIKPNQQSPLDNLRRTLWPMCRRNLYLFLKHLFLHWPLDSSFRLVLETWVSYIQPWRYTNLVPKSPLHSPTPNEPIGTVAKHWLAFLCENILFYTNLFLLFLRRIQRLDLAAPKNAHIVFRVSKVFSQDCLISMLQDVEDSFEGGLQMHKSLLSVSTMGLQGPSSPSPSQMSDLPPHTMSQLVRQHILEVEGQNFQFISTTNQQVTKEIIQLVKLIKTALDAVNAELAVASEPSNSKSTNSNWFLDALKSLFDSPISKESETTQDEMKRSVAHLDYSMKAFCRIFGVSIPSANHSLLSSDHQTSFNDSVLNRSTDKPHCPDQILSENGPILTHLGRQQLITGMRRFDLKYMGDPDLKPICSFEIGPFVRHLYSLSNKINRKHENDIISLFYRQNFVGRISRAILMPPQTVYEYPNNQGISIRRRVAVDLPPRISLRFLANSRLIFALIICYSILWLFGGSYLKFSFQILFPLVLCYIAYKIFTQGSILHRPLQLNVDPNFSSRGEGYNG